jgi:hypothetical protein
VGGAADSAKNYAAPSCRVGLSRTILNEKDIAHDGT